MYIMPAKSNSHLKYTWFHTYIYFWVALVLSEESHFLSRSCCGMEWYDPCSLSTCGHQTEPPGALLPQWNGRGRGNNLAPFEGLGQFLQSILRGWGFNRPSLCIRCASCDEPLKDVGCTKRWLQLRRTGALGFWALLWRGCLSEG